MPQKRTPSKKEKTERVIRPFPRVTLEDALKVPKLIREKNGGNPWSRDQIAEAVGIAEKSTNFQYLLSASRDFGLTQNSQDVGKIELAPLGKELLYASSPVIEKNKEKEAFLRIEIFKKVLEHYKGSDLPEMKYLGNTLEKEFSLHPEVHEEFSTLFRQNCDFLGISSGFSGQTKDDKEKSIKHNNEETPITVTLAEPEKKSSLVAFVIMPFVEKQEIHPKGYFQEVLRSLITPAARDAGFIVKTANRQGSEVIQSTIINELLEADLVIADLTEHNPNVLFELGVRMANDKPVALIKSSGTGKIFDVDNLLRVYEYSSNLWATTIEKDRPAISEHIKATWENKNSENTYLRILRKQK